MVADVAHRCRQSRGRGPLAETGADLVTVPKAGSEPSTARRRFADAGA
jgi:hypothetical protein